MRTKLIEAINQESIPFQNNTDLDSIIEAIGDAQYVLLGEASHGTSEFYTIRSEISKRLIKEKGFKVIAVEGDWPSCFKINSYIKGYEKKSADEALKEFTRWPTWMWANEEVKELITWLYEYNQSLVSNKIGFYGLDVYSLWESMDEIIKVLQKNDSVDLETAKKAFSCFEPFYRKPEQYAVSAAFYGEDCTEEVVRLLIKLEKINICIKMGMRNHLIWRLIVLSLLMQKHIIEQW